MNNCPYWYNGGSKDYAEMIYSVVAIKTKAFLASLHEFSPEKNTSGLLELSLLEKLSSTLRSLLKSVSFLFEKWGEWRKWWIVLSTEQQLQIGFNVPWTL